MSSNAAPSRLTTVDGGGDELLCNKPRKSTIKRTLAYLLRPPRKWGVLEDASRTPKRSVCEGRKVGIGQIPISNVKLTIGRYAQILAHPELTMARASVPEASASSPGGCQMQGGFMPKTCTCSRSCKPTRFTQSTGAH